MANLINYEIIEAGSSLHSLRQSNNLLKDENKHLTNKLSKVLMLCVIAGIAVIVVGYYVYLQKPKIVVRDMNEKE